MTRAITRISVKKDPQASFKSIVFCRSNTTPSTPTGGSFSNPVPAGWNDGVPSGTSQLWMTTRVFTSDGMVPQQTAWTTPQPVSDTADIDFEFSAVATNPKTPTTAPTYWHDTATEHDIWMAVRKCKNGSWGSWEISKIKGEDGKDAHSPYVGDNGNWYFYDDAQGKFVDSGRTAQGDDGHSPYIGTNGNWWEWDAGKGRYTDTGIKAKGEDGNPGDPGEDGTSSLPIYRNDDVKPATPSGATFPPKRWRLDPESKLSITSILPDLTRSTLDSNGNQIPFEVKTIDYDGVTPFYYIEGETSNNIKRAVKISFRTDAENQQLSVEVISSSEKNYDFCVVGLLDSTNTPTSAASTYTARVSGEESRVTAVFEVETVGDHFVYVWYIKDGSQSSFDDRCYFRVKPQSEAMWMSMAQVKDGKALSYTTPIAITPARGPQGARTNVTVYEPNTLYYAGNYGEPVLDYVFYKGRYYRCTKTHISRATTSLENPYDEVGHGYDTWALESNQDFIATKVLFAGEDDNGWIMENGIIRHTSGMVRLSSDGSIVASNGNFKLDANGNIEANSGTFAGYLRIPFKSLTQHTIQKNGRYWLSDTFNLVNDAIMIDNELVLPDDISFSGAVVTVSSFRLSKMDGGVTISTETPYNLYSANKLQTADRTFPQAFSSLYCMGLGVIQLLAVPPWAGGNRCTWIVITEAATGLSYL